MPARSYLLVLLACAAPGCVRVSGVQREKLASPSMMVGLGDAGMAGSYRAKFVESKSGGGLPGSAPGGGCGCAQ
jgi:hypothetical protein